VLTYTYAMGGIIAFVMPRSVLSGAKHHVKFREFKKPSIKLLEIIDNDFSTDFRVSPLFNVPSCVLIGIKGCQNEWPVRTLALNGKLPERNAKLEEIKLEVMEYLYKPPIISSYRSYYYDLFKAGASLIPRPLWFVDFVIDEKLGIHPTKPKVRTSRDVLEDAKDRWKNVTLEGNVEKEFIFATLLSKDLKPFGYKKLRPVVLPVKKLKNSFKILNEEELLKIGATGMVKWLKKAQETWKENATNRDKENFPHIIYSIDYLNKLSNQDPSKRYVVISAASGKYTAACVIDRENLGPFDIRIRDIIPQSFIADTKTMYFETNSKEEAYYLSAIINSNIIDELIKPLQTRGHFGERDILRRPFEFPIPKFNPNDERHKRLAELGEICHEEAKKIRETDRKTVKEKLKKYMDEIDKLVAEILGL